MRSFLALSLFFAACGGSSMMMTGDDQVTPDAPVTGDTPAIEVVSKDAMLNPGDQITYCYYFHTNNTTEALINKWESHMSPGSHHAILFLNPNGNPKPDGTLDPNGDCGGGNAQGAAIWTYATQTPDQIENLPPDDGAGKPLAQKIPPNSAAVLQLHYLNAGETAIMAHIDLKAFALPAGAAFTQTDAYVTYNNDISIAPGATGVKVSASCPLPAGVKFWTMSSHSHKQSVATEVDDGAGAVFMSGIGGPSGTDWEHPGAQNWDNPNFYSFTANKLTWSCTYDNTGDNKNNTVVSGPSASTNEMCMATGYFFPSTGPKFEVEFNGQCFGL